MITLRHQKTGLLLLATLVGSGADVLNANVSRTRKTSGFVGWGLFTPPTDSTLAMKSKLDPESTLADNLAAELFSNLTLSVYFFIPLLYLSTSFWYVRNMYDHVLLCPEAVVVTSLRKDKLYVRINAKVVLK